MLHRPKGVDLHKGQVHSSMTESDVIFFMEQLLKSPGYEAARNMCVPLGSEFVHYIYRLHTSPPSLPRGYSVRCHCVLIHRCMSLLCYTTMGGGDEGRHFHLSDIVKFGAHEALKPATAWVLSLMQYDGKAYTVRSATQAHLTHAQIETCLYYATELLSLCFRILPHTPKLVAWLSVRPTNIKESKQMRCPIQEDQKSFRSAIQHLLRNQEFRDMLVAYKECEIRGVRLFVCLQRPDHLFPSFSLYTHISILITQI